MLNLFEFHLPLSPTRGSNDSPLKFRSKLGNEMVLDEFKRTRLVMTAIKKKYTADASKGIRLKMLEPETLKPAHITYHDVEHKNIIPQLLPRNL